MLSDFGLGWDEERDVREIWKESLLDRRQRGWARQYLEQVLVDSKMDDEPARRAYRYSRALTKVGDDESVDRIDQFTTANDLRPHIRHWLKKTRSEIRRNWRKKMDGSSGPWSHVKGSVEDLVGEIVHSDGKRVDAKLSLWCRHRTGPSDLGEWGGIAEPVAGSSLWRQSESSVEIKIPGRQSAIAHVVASRGNPSESRLTLHGSGPYPVA